MFYCQQEQYMQLTVLKRSAPVTSDTADIDYDYDPPLFKQNVSHLSLIMTKPAKWHLRSADTQISLGIHPDWSVFAVRMKKAWYLSYPLRAQWRLIRLGGCPGWSESWLAAHVILLVLSWCGSYCKFIKTMANENWSFCLNKLNNFHSNKLNNFHSHL